MTMAFDTSPFVLALVGAMALLACSGNDDDKDTALATPERANSEPVTATSAVGHWSLHYEWEKPPPEAWVTFFGSSLTGDRDVAIPSATQKRGMVTANTAFGFGPMTSIVEDGAVTWTFHFNDDAFRLDFTGKGTGASLSGEAKFSNDATTARWTATKVTTIAIPPEKLAGDWTFDYQWSGRTPGDLLVTCDANRTCRVPGGQPGASKTDGVGTASFLGNQVTLKYPDSTDVGVAISDSLIWGYMDSATSTGVWTATRGKPASSGSDTHGCTADVDCGSCERCERTTGNCISRLVCH